MYLNAKDVPAMIRNTFSYNGNKVEVKAAESVTLVDNYWSGGSKTEYRGLDLATGEVLPPSTEYGTPFTSPGTPRVALKPGKAIVAHKIVCGKDLGLVVFVHPDNLTKLIPEVKALDTDEEIVLSYTKGFKSSYGGISNYRFHTARQRTGITLERWDAAKATLITKKMLTKAGAITPDGRNAVESSKVQLY